MLNITLNEFYNYVFGDWADPNPVTAKVKLSDSELAAKNTRNKEKIKTIFTFILNNPHLSAEFRVTLRSLNNSALERILYENNTDVIKRAAGKKILNRVNIGKIFIV